MSHSFFLTAFCILFHYTAQSSHCTVLLPKIFLHQCLFHQFQLFEALLYSLLLLVYMLYKGSKLILQGKRRNDKVKFSKNL